MTVNRNPEHFGVALLKLIHLLTKSDDLGRADKRKIQRVEKYNDVFSLIFGKFNLLETAIRHHGLGSEIWSRFSN